MAYLTKRLGRWQAAYRGPDHKERTRTFDRKVDAEKWLAANVTDIARGAWVDPVAGRVTFSEYAKGWKATKADVAERTRINIEGRLDNHVVPYFGDMPVASIRPTDVRKFVAKLTGAGLAPSTVKATYLTASQVFAQAVTDGIIARTPCIDIRLPRERQHEEMHFLSPVQVNDLASATAERYRALIYTAAYGGLRAGELMALRVESLELGGLGGTISVTSAASEVRGKLVFGPTKTGRRVSFECPASCQPCWPSTWSATRPRTASSSPPAREVRSGTATSIAATSGQLLLQPARRPWRRTVNTSSQRASGSTICATPALPSSLPTVGTCRR